MPESLKPLSIKKKGNKTMSKKRKQILFALLLPLVLIGCGKNTATDKTNTPSISQKKPSTKITLKSLSIKTMPNKTTYKENEVFESDGLVLLATYSDESEKEIKSGYSFTEDPLTLDTKEVIVRYSTKSVTVPIKVEALILKSLSLKTEGASLDFGTRSEIDLSGLEFLATYDNDTTGVVTIETAGVSMKDEKGKDFQNKTLGSVLGEGEHTITVNYREKSVKLIIHIINGYKIEAESASNEENPTKESYVKAKDASGNYVTIATNLNTGNGSICGIKESKASGGQFLGGLKAGSTIEFYFTSTIATKATINISAASNWVLKDDGANKPTWTGDCQVNEVFEASANGKPVFISDDVVLKGSGNKDNTVGDYKLYRNFTDVDFGTMDVKVGTNMISIQFMSAEVFASYPKSEITGKPKYQNSTNSNYGVPGIDYLQVTLN